MNMLSAFIISLKLSLVDFQKIIAKYFGIFLELKKNPEIIICGMIQMKTIENQITTSKAWLRDLYYCYINRPKKLDMEHSV